MKLLLVVLLFAVVVYVATRLLQERGQGGTGGTPSLRRPSRPGPPTRPVAPDDDETFLRDLGGEVADILQVDKIVLVLESAEDEEDPVVRRLHTVLAVAEPGFIDEYLLNGRMGLPRQVTLRQLQQASGTVYGPAADWIRAS